MSSGADENPLIKTVKEKQTRKSRECWSTLKIMSRKVQVHVWDMGIVYIHTCAW
jgi:hypothetical protein